MFAEHKIVAMFLLRLRRAQPSTEIRRLVEYSAGVCNALSHAETFVGARGVVKPQHLLQAICATPSCGAARIAISVRPQPLVRIAKRRAGKDTTRVLSFALREALIDGNPSVHSGHLLLALLGHMGIAVNEAVQKNFFPFRMRLQAKRSCLGDGFRLCCVDRSGGRQPSVGGLVGSLVQMTSASSSNAAA